MDIEEQIKSLKKGDYISFRYNFHNSEETYTETVSGYFKEWYLHKWGDLVVVIVSVNTGKEGDGFYSDSMEYLEIINQTN